MDVLVGDVGDGERRWVVLALLGGRAVTLVDEDRIIDFLDVVILECDVANVAGSSTTVRGWHSVSKRSKRGRSIRGRARSTEGRPSLQRP